ncbi:MAG TPA: DUF445 family protein [Gemmatimonadaceae bacterium]|nr:DUF445 family protein [Gemmatimonadaceae bacterium]
MVGIPLPDLKNVAERQARLTRMKRIATGLFVFVTAVFVATRLLESRYPWLGWVRAMSEAAMVGALADWFAVTALFRHPMGIPIPHTAIVPNRKDRIGASLGGFVQNNFLSPDLIRAKLQQLGISRRLGEWLREPANARKISMHASKALAGTVQVLRDDDVQDLLDRSVIARIRATRVAPVVGNALSLITASNRHQELLDEALKLLDRVVDQNDEIIRDRIRKESPWWLPESVDDKIHDKIVTAIENLLHAVTTDPNHPLRARFDAAVDRFVERLKTSPEVIAKGEELKEELLAHPSVRQFSAAVWTDAKEAIVKYSEGPLDGEVRPIDRGIVSLGETMLEDPELLAKVDGWILDATLYIVEQYRTEVGQFIADTVRGWDPEDTSRKIELAVGRDLQFIRINGTIMGALVGLLLYLVGRVL